jgi:hypothetical protein
MEAGGAVVGSFGCIPFLASFRGTDLPAATGNTLVVEPSYRNHSVKLIARFFKQTEFALLTSTTTGGASRQVFRRLFKMELMPQEGFSDALFWVLNPRRFASACLERTVRNTVVRAVGKVAAPALLAAEGALRRRWARPANGQLTTRQLDPQAAGDEFDALWARKSSADPRMMVERTAAAVRWRFGTPAAQDKSRLIGSYEGSRLLGFAALVTSVGRNGIKKANLVDLFVNGDRPDVVQGLLSAAFADARERGTDVLEVVGLPPSVRRCLAAARPFSRRLAPPGEGSYLYLARDPELSAALRSPGAWYASAYDGDEAF